MTLKILEITLWALILIAIGVMIYAGVGIYTTNKKIEEICHTALAFEKPSELAKAICYSHGYTK